MDGSRFSQMQRANKLVNEICDSDERLCYIDIVPAMLNAAGQARPDLFTYDGVHMNKKGYALWTRVIRPFVAEMGTDNRVVTHGPA